MRNACIIVQDFYKDNKLFNLNDKIINRDNCIYSFYYLKNELKKYDYNLSTQDINTIKNSEIVLYNEMPKILPERSDIKKSYLIIFESELIKPENWDTEKHSYFNKIFTWNDEYVDNKKYFKVNFSHKIPRNFRIDTLKRPGFCTLIACNKSNKHRNELYSERIKAVQWFEKNQPNDFEFYGINWNKFKKPFERLNRYKLLQELFTIRFDSYKGVVISKFETMSKYKFAICYENAKGIPGYITEKIFDCFFAGTIPVYWGAPNVSDFIPENCFIDIRKYKNYDELYNYMKNMSEKEYTNYIRSIEEYVNSDKIYPFSAECFAEVILKNISQEVLNGKIF